MTRLEGRGDAPPTRAYTDQLVETLKATGIEAVWHSAVSQECRALFPSRVFPHPHPRASLRAFHYLVDRVHAAGRPILSWYALNHCIGLLEDHPDWRIIPMQGPGIPRVNPKDPALRPFCCINTPYGDLLPEFCREVVRDVGFDGLWFDGSTLAILGNAVPGCLCPACRRKFRADTGEALPERPDFDSPVFRQWVTWRYEQLMRVWKACVDAVMSERADAVVAFNNYRRWREVGWHTAIPLRPLGWNAMMAGELDLQSLHGDFQMKMHRAYECRHTPESWMALCDHWMLWAPDAEPEPILQAVASCACAGGVMSMGTGADLRQVRPLLKAIQQTASPLRRFLGGETVEYAAVWASQQTQDFFYRGEPLNGYRAWHGANDLCNAAHLQTSVVFDGHVSEGRLARYPVLLAGNAACLSRDQAARLKDYVEAGGVLVLCADAGTRDECGQLWPTPLLDRWIGLRRRKPGQAFVTLAVTDRVLAAVSGRYVSLQTAHPVPAVEAWIRPLARLRSWAFGKYGPAAERRAAKLPAGAWAIRRGRGHVLYLSPDIFHAHCVAPTPRLCLLFRALVTRFRLPEVTLEAPAAVVLNTRQQADGTWVCLLHNAPGHSHRYPIRWGTGERLPVRNLVLRLGRRRVRTAVSGLTGCRFKVVEGERAVRIPELDRVEAVCLTFRPDSG
jgi:hypothetical protein